MVVSQPVPGSNMEAASSRIPARPLQEVLQEFPLQDQVRRTEEIVQYVVFLCAVVGPGPMAC